MTSYLCMYLSQHKALIKRSACFLTETTAEFTTITPCLFASTSRATPILTPATAFTRIRHAHQVTTLALAKLQEDAFLHTEGQHSDADKEAQRQKMVLESPTLSCMFLLQNTGDGLLQRTPGFLCGCRPVARGVQSVWTNHLHK